MSTTLFLLTVLFSASAALGLGSYGNTTANSTSSSYASSHPLGSASSWLAAVSPMSRSGSSTSSEGTALGGYIASGLGLSPDGTTTTASGFSGSSDTRPPANGSPRPFPFYGTRNLSASVLHPTLYGSGASHAVTDLSCYTPNITAYRTIVSTSTLAGTGVLSSGHIPGTFSGRGATYSGVCANSSHTSASSTHGFGVVHGTGPQSVGAHGAGANSTGAYHSELHNNSRSVAGSDRGSKARHGTQLNATGLYGTGSYGTGKYSSEVRGTASGQGNHTNTTLSATGRGYSYANACNQASVSWTKKYMTEFYITASNFSPTAFTTAPPAADVTTLCDGIPRMVGNVTTLERPFASLQQVYYEKAYPTATPNCSIQPTDCASLLQSYSSKHQVPASVSLGPIHTSYEPFILDDFPRCQTNTVACGNAGADCALAGSGIQLFYWPQTWAGGYCGPKTESLTLGPTIPGKPNTATLGNYTFTSPTVYIKYDTMVAQDICGTNVGPTLTSGFIPLPSESVFSKVPYFMTPLPWDGPRGLMHVGREVGISDAVHSGWPGINPDYGDARVPLTYPDLDTETVPAIPYYQVEMRGGSDPWCYFGGCPTMVPFNFRPQLAVPDQARSLATEWLSCTLAWAGLDDPPSALAPQSAIATVSSPHSSQTTPATPCITAVPISETGTPNSLAHTIDHLPSARPSSPNASPVQSTPNKPETKTPSGAESKASPGSPSTKSSSQHYGPSKPKDPPTLSGLSTLGVAPAISALNTRTRNTLSELEAHSTLQDTQPSANTKQDPNASLQHTKGLSAVPVPDTTPVVVGGVTVTPTASSNYVVGGKTITPGDPGVVVSGTTFSIDPSGSSVFVDGSGSPVPSATKEGHGGATIVTLGNNPVTASRLAVGSGIIVIGSQVISEGGPAITVNGQVVTAASGGKVEVNGQTSFDAPVASKHGASEGLSKVAPTVNGRLLTALEELAPTGTGQDHALGTQTFEVGGPTRTVDGRVVSATLAGVVLDYSASAAVFTEQGLTFTALETTGAQGHTEAVIVQETVLPNGATTTVAGEQTLTLDGSAIITDDETISLGSSGIVVESGDYTRMVPFSNAGLRTTMVASTLGPGETVLAVRGTNMLFSRTIIGSGSSKTTEYIHGSLTLTLTVVGTGLSQITVIAGGQAQTPGPVVTAGGKVLTMIQHPDFILLEDSSSTMTVSDGSAVTFEGQRISMLTNGRAAVVDGTTVGVSRLDDKTASRSTSFPAAVTMLSGSAEPEGIRPTTNAATQLRTWQSTAVRLFGTIVALVHIM